MEIIKWNKVFELSIERVRFGDSLEAEIKVMSDGKIGLGYLAKDRIKLSSDKGLNQLRRNAMILKSIPVTPDQHKEISLMITPYKRLSIYEKAKKKG